MPQHIAQYEVIRPLAAGRHAATWLAVGDVPPADGKGLPERRVVVVQRYTDLPDRDRVFTALKAQLALVRQVQHPLPVATLEVLDADSAVVLEYVHGTSLSTALAALRAAKEQVFTEAAVEIGAEVAELLHRAYFQLGAGGDPLHLLHRSLRPSCIFFTPDGQVRLADLGYAALVAPPLGRAVRAGAADELGLLAPEQARGEENDHSTDLYRLGLVLYEVLAGQSPWQVARRADPDGDFAGMVARGDLREPCRALEQTLPALGPVVARALEPRPADRYATGQDLAADLRRQLYRERGAYLREFCEFYFGAIAPLGAPPAVDPHGGARGRRKTIEERLRETQARMGDGGEAGKSLAPEESSGPSPAVAGPAGRSGMIPSQASSVPPVRNGEGATPSRSITPRGEVPGLSSGGVSMSSSAGGRRAPPRPPVGGGASRTTPFEPGAANAVKKSGSDANREKKVGERAPDETGMLPMELLTQNRDRQEAEADPGATAFFAIPAPKAERARPAPPPPVAPVVAAPAVTGPSSNVGFAPPPVRPPLGAPPANPAGQPAPLVQGPVASYGGGASPFQVQGPLPGSAPPAEASQRVQSTRVAAILLSVFLLVGVAVVAAVWIQVSGGDEEVVVAPPQPVAGPAPVKAPAVVPKSADTGAPPPPAPEPVKKTSKPKPAATTTPAPTSRGPGTVSVRLADGSAATSIEIVCPSGFRSRSALSNGAGSVSGVPAEDCTLFFKGGAPAQYKPVRGGMSLSCSIQGTTGLCR